MEEVEKEVEEVLFDHLHATAFQHTGLGRTILGSAENVRTITQRAPQRRTSRSTTPRRGWCSWARARWSTTTSVRLAEGAFSQSSARRFAGAERGVRS